MAPFLKRFLFIGTLFFCAAGLILDAQNPNVRNLRNSQQIHRELILRPATQAFVSDIFPSFSEYQDMVMFHPEFGYFASGRVNLTNDYQTFPIVMAPRFGQMVAEQIFHMWEGMRSAGSLRDGDPFTIAEFGPGNGAMAESILEYVEQKSNGNDTRWKQFAGQILYVCYDRSLALSNIQRERNKRFGSRFSARIADPANPTAAILPESLQGVILSDELADDFSVHKVILSPSGEAEVAFVVPSLSDSEWQALRPLLSAQVASALEADDLVIKKKLFSGMASPAMYLSRTSLPALLSNLVPTKEYESAANALQFQEVYLPAAVIPALAIHLRRYAAVYSGILAKTPRGLVSYINLGSESFIQGAARLLKSGYVLTIDYGSTWDGILADDSAHLRTYGPVPNSGATPQEAFAYDPYIGPTLNNITTDVNFSLLADVGQLAGLKPIYFGSQKALQSGTGISVEDAPVDRQGNVISEQFYAWAADFVKPGVFKVLVQQKEGTDKAYRFPDNRPESLGTDPPRLTEAELLRASEIKKRLAGIATPLTVPGR